MAKQVRALSGIACSDFGSSLHMLCMSICAVSITLGLVRVEKCRFYLWFGLSAYSKQVQWEKINSEAQSDREMLWMYCSDFHVIVHSCVFYLKTLIVNTHTHTEFFMLKNNCILKTLGISRLYIGYLSKIWVS